MKVVVFFVQPDGRGRATPLYHLYGRYNICGFMFVGETDAQAFCTWSGHVFTKLPWTRQDDPPALFVSQACEPDFLMLSVSSDEARMLLATCEACAVIKKPFNLRDLILMHVPFREVEDLPVDKAPTLNNAQAVILMLRACLRADARLKACVDGLHSRQTVAETLYDALVLSQQTVPVTRANISSLVRWPVEERGQDTRARH